MKIKIKKIIASILTLMMIFTQVPISSAVYANSGTEITEGGTYQIRGNSINIDDYENSCFFFKSVPTSLSVSPKRSGETAECNGGSVCRTRRRRERPDKRCGSE